MCIIAITIQESGSKVGLTVFKFSLHNTMQDAGISVCVGVMIGNPNVFACSPFLDTVEHRYSFIMDFKHIGVCVCNVIAYVMFLHMEYGGDSFQKVYFGC